MVIFTKWPAVGSFVAAFACAALPVMAQFKPGVVRAGLVAWLPLLYPIAAILLAYALMTMAYHWGVKAGSKAVATPPTDDANADPPGRTVGDLIYAVGVLTNILLDEGDLRHDAARVQIARLERQHRAWHGPFQLQVRDAFLAEARKAMSARQKQSSWTLSYGDFPAGQREGFQQRLTDLRGNLLLVLQALQAITPDHGGGPELIEA